MTNKCEWVAPWSRWAIEEGLTRGEMEHENWKSLERHWSYFIRNCVNAKDDIEWSRAGTIGTFTGSPWHPRADIRVTKFRVSAILSSPGG